jgi:type II secretory pathway pseudopilin PulG
MIRKIIIISVAVVVVFSVMRNYEQQSIITVINQNRQAAINALRITRFNSGRSITNFQSKVYLANVEKISTAQCPNKFRLAWLNYIQTLQRENAPFAGLGSLTEFEVSALGRSGNGTKDALDRLDKLNENEAWMRVETAALNYGVQLIRQ